MPRIWCDHKMRIFNNFQLIIFAAFIVYCQTTFVGNSSRSGGCSCSGTKGCECTSKKSAKPVLADTLPASPPPPQPYYFQQQPAFIAYPGPVTSYVLHPSYVQSPPVLPYLPPQNYPSPQSLSYQSTLEPAVMVQETSYPHSIESSSIISLLPSVTDVYSTHLKPEPSTPYPSYLQQEQSITSPNADEIIYDLKETDTNNYKIQRDIDSLSKIKEIVDIDEDFIEVYKAIKKLTANRKKSLQFAPKSSVDPKCNDHRLRQAIIENIDSNPAVAKRQIQAAVREKVEGNIDTICSAGSFSYLTNTDLYCEIETADITCLVFRQAS